jgi:Uma2 family endonuclease
MRTATGCSWEDWLALPEADGGRRYELVDGELVVSPAPGYRHQRVLNLLQTDLTNWAREHGGQVLPGPFDVYVSEGNYYKPDLIYVAPERVPLIEERGLPAAPDLVLEVSSPQTRATWASSAPATSRPVWRSTGSRRPRRRSGGGAPPGRGRLRGRGQPQAR